MSGIKRFEDFDAWKKARELAKEVYSVSARARFCRDRGLKDQIRRSAVSAMSNIAEGFGRDSDAEFTRSSVPTKSKGGQPKTIDCRLRTPD